MVSLNAGGDLLWPQFHDPSRNHHLLVVISLLNHLACLLQSILISVIIAFYRPIETNYWTNST